MKLANAHTLYVILFLALIGLNEAKAQVWTMQQCIDTALVYNKNLQIGRNNISVGEQKEKESKGNLFPKITTNGEYKYYTDLPYQLMPLSVFGGPDGQFKEAQFGVQHNVNASLQFSMPLYSPQIYGAIQTTKVATELAELQFLKTEEQVYFEISNLYYNAQILHQQLIFIDSNLVNAERLLNNIKLLNEQLLAKGTDVSKVKLQLAQLATQKESISGKYEQVLNSLKLSMGISIEKNFQIESIIHFQSATEYASSTILDIRIVKAQNRFLTTELNTLNHSRFLPTLNLFGTYGTMGFGYDKKPNDFLKFYPLGYTGIQISYPLFNGTVTKRKIVQKRYEIKNNELQLGLISEQNNMQIENAKLQRRIAIKSVETTTEIIKLAQTIYDQTLLQQTQGTASLTDVLLADTALREAQQTYLTAVIDYLKADLELKKLTGNISTIK